ncbi:AzlC family ABC transporter permease [Leeia sp. TBRC 13508]|uniref:AzlC family ABC transporter permease n=1 Tax=Leeia speluncae TaxID=2884804 RepID=A0ABS8D9M8_9NEIS|nr:AzlC family ABC transporter permease [Leeia speluncae]MCB6184900.1 AzlC family ABC transporter permease [Leeia speluncae]
MNLQFKNAFREGIQQYFSLSLAMIPWAMATAIAMRGAGYSTFETFAINLIVYGATAQLGTMPLVISGAPLWLIAITAVALNLRFLIFSAIIAPAFHDMPKKRRWLAGYLLSDGVVAAFSSKLLGEKNQDVRWGTFLGPSTLNWVMWQLSTWVGLVIGSSLPPDLPIGFMATIALLALVVPMLIKDKSILVGALVSGTLAVLLRNFPLKLGFLLAILIGMTAGVLWENWQTRKPTNAA